jgi:hypothetical protein
MYKLVIISMIISSVNNLIAQPLKSLPASDCRECACFTNAALDTIAKGLRNYEVCNIEREELKAFIERKHEAKQEWQWYQEPSFIAGGLVISFSLGALFVVVANQR